MIELKKKEIIDNKVIDDIIYRYDGGLDDPEFMNRFNNSQAYHLTNSIEAFLMSSFAYRSVVDSSGKSIPFQSITSESYFNYLDYIELQEARKSSRVAMLFSIAAIIISLIALLYPTTIRGSVTLNEEQFNKLINEIKTEIIENNN